MKVLWFTNTSVNAFIDSSDLKSSGGWLNSLEVLINKQSDIKLGIIFESKANNDVISKNNTTYYPINEKVNHYINNKFLVKVCNRLFVKSRLSNNKQQQISAVIEEFKPDIIHFHGTETRLFEAKELIHDIPVVVSIQGIVSSINHQVYSLNSLIFCKSLRERFQIKTMIQQWQVRIQREKQNLKDVKFIIGRTNYDRVISQALAPKSNYHHIDEILRDEFYQNRWEAPDKTKLRIYTTMSGSFLKGFDMVVSSAIMLKEKIDFEWIIAGLDDSDYLVKLIKKHYKKEYPINNFNLLGRVSSARIITEMSKSHIYVMASHIENSPNALCEALLIGMPCIASNVGGTSSLINDNVDGLLYQHTDPLSLMSQILWLSNNYNKGIEMGDKARVRALKRHDKLEIYERLISCYSIINGYNK